MNNFLKNKKVHFIGIGGIGVSALARYYLHQGAAVSGSDLAQSEITDDLEKQGVKIAIGTHKAGNVPRDVDMVVYSPAVKPDNPERLEIKERSQGYKIRVLSYPQALGELTKKYFTVAVSGTHGKSTTTAMIALILAKAGLDPTVIVGTKLKEFGNANFRHGGSKYLIIEADEWQASFLNYWPKIIVLTNIEAEHLDYYRNLGHIIGTFRRYVGHLPKEGSLVMNGDDKNTLRAINRKSKPPFKIQNYSRKQPEAGKLKKILKIPGEHNIYNALAALTVSRLLNIPDKIACKALSGYRGAWRRFEILGKLKGATVISDYAHHPTEIRATLAAGREKFPDKEIWCVFQPHQYQRTEQLFNDFAGAFDPADKIMLLDIYGVAGREKSAKRQSERQEISSRRLAAAIKKRGKNIRYLPNFKTAADLSEKTADKNKVIFIMGAGDIGKMPKMLRGLGA